jgi:hypothetical protein
MLPFCPAFRSPDMTMYLVFSAFTSRPISLLATTKASVFYFIVELGMMVNVVTSSL